MYDNISAPGLRARPRVSIGRACGGLLSILPLEWAQIRRYWIVGDTANTRGRSLFVRLTGPPHGQGARGKWQDAATGEHGDLLDILAAREGHCGLPRTLTEARRFLGKPEWPAKDGYARGTPFIKRVDTSRDCEAHLGRGEAAFRHSRRVLSVHRCLAPPYPADLRFHPALDYRDHEIGEIAFHPALLAAVRDASGGLRAFSAVGWLPTARKRP